MDSIIEILKVLVGQGKPDWQDSAILDPTTYQIITTSHTYCGRIQYQDDVYIKLVTDKPRVVKILKENIIQITIVEGGLITERVRAN
jgi:hypothetical protein